MLGKQAVAAKSWMDMYTVLLISSNIFTCKETTLVANEFYLFWRERDKRCGCVLGTLSFILHWEGKPNSILLSEQQQDPTKNIIKFLN